MTSPGGLTQSISALLGARECALLTVDEAGALVEHPFRLEQRENRLRFEWYGEKIDLTALAGASELQEKLSDREQRLIYHTPFTFATRSDALRRALLVHAARIEQAREANSAGEPDTSTDSIDDVGTVLRERRLGFVSFVLRNGEWRRYDTMSPDQPLNGFTVAIYETEDQLRLLRLAYEEADPEGRALLRQFAAESIASTIRPPE